ncbi:motility associated factor glycosyltransferase family protein [Hydrocarboniclastica marina]|uniref:DUF115 domain-containing protein n=1 Tax=Hydrocarboniclastica marina TaxID=2259620 RepID=A0A4V1D8K7_9ALTE|nr:6-hydroxymethylpterin diphosphokinase MptE-like protein [Hydrocarboniclastica marina]MAL97122.1 hypothetical protein [Alteromonadaceae bacterium]QCF25530.1 DUF115 domain-containing protein [Hydrocarboniclastica marina]|tara:strand:+ start:1541 stop:3646 length:2106 start_codon:yes stop_codon:yes gene_type:complete
MAETDEDIAAPFLRRRVNNLAYFRKYRPELYDFFAELQLNHIELVVTPGLTDVDLTDHGQTVYRNHAQSFSRDEVDKFLSENPGDKAMLTLAPSEISSYNPNRFASHAVRQCFQYSSFNKENFKGYFRGESFPSVVFLGCGLGYHIEALATKADIVDAVVFEPDAERFAASLYTVDWEAICTRFRRKGCSISFSIPVSPDSANVRRVLGGKLAEMVPLYPFFTIYYNHLANVELFRTAKDLERDLPIVGANWGGYDFELRGLNNVVHNIESARPYLKPKFKLQSEQPVFVVGSGPSIDKRIADIERHYNKAIVISAGTGLRALLNHGIKPHFHLELDADYIIYEILSDLGKEALHGITLLASIDVNPLVPDLFDKTLFYFKRNNYLPPLLDASAYAVDYCNPTCTNAAMAIACALGFSNIFLFGTDYGYRNKAQHHSRHSIYGDTADSEFSSRMRATAGADQSEIKTFEVPAVDGGYVLTRTDYYAARRQVEQFIEDMSRTKLALNIRNCADGAAIEGAPWLSSQALDELLESHDDSAVTELDRLLPSETGKLSIPLWRKNLELLSREIKSSANAYLQILAHARLNGRRDLVVVGNEVRAYLNRIGPGSGRQTPVAIQMMGYQMLKGSIHHFLYVGLSHGMACETDEELIHFSRGWKKEFEAFLKELPHHFQRAVVEAKPTNEDPWVVRRLIEAEPGLENR